MSITKTKERIATMKAGEPCYEWVDMETLYHTGFFTEQGVADFQALASSHTALLTAIQNYLKPQPNDSQSEKAHNELMLAIREAEGE